MVPRSYLKIMIRIVHVLWVCVWVMLLWLLLLLLLLLLL